MTVSKDEPHHVDPDTPAKIARDRQPIPLPEGQPGDDGSDPAPESDMESGLLKPLENTPVVRNPNAERATGDGSRPHDDPLDPLGTRADTSVRPTTNVPDAAPRKPD